MCALTTTLTHWGRVTYKCVSKLDHHLFRWWLFFIILNNAGLQSVGSLWTNLSEIGMKIQKFSYKKISLKTSTAKWWPFYLGLNVSITGCIQVENWHMEIDHWNEQTDHWHTHTNLTLRVYRISRIRTPTLWRHQMETFSALLAFCAGNSPVTGEFPAQRPVIDTELWCFLWSAPE